MSEPNRTDLGTDITLMGDEHVRRYRETDGEVGYIWNGAPILLLTVTGRKSGQPRTTPLIYAEAAGAQVVIASQGGAPNHPAWFLNLVANPAVEVQIRGERFAARARVAQGDERAALWAAAAKVWPNYDVYAGRTTRVIPVVVLERTELQTP